MKYKALFERDERYKDEPYYLRVLWNNVKPGGRPHLGAVADCFNEWGAYFGFLDMPINDKLREVCKHGYIIRRTYETTCGPAAGLIIKINEAIKKAIGDGEEIDRSLVEGLSDLFNDKFLLEVKKELETAEERRKKEKGL